jgi:hypothetical protein
MRIGFAETPENTLEVVSMANNGGLPAVESLERGSFE